MGTMSGSRWVTSTTFTTWAKQLVDPDTGQVLGVDETMTGSGEVVEVK